MAELFHTLLVFFVIFLVVFVLNVVPMFAPPTWTVLSFIAIRFNSNIVLLALVGAVAATLGRLALAKLSTVIIRQKFLSEATKSNIDAVRTRLESSKKLTFSILLFYAFSPFPSNHLFIAYGLTALKLRLIAVPFLLGRVVSYSFWAFTASSVAQLLAYESTTTKSFFSYYFIASQLFGLVTIYLFTKIDWPRVFAEKRLRWRAKARLTTQLSDAGSDPSSPQTGRTNRMDREDRARLPGDTGPSTREDSDA
jgi:membrane protein YqaA with SNARE-associated domain